MLLADYTKQRGRQSQLCQAIGAHASDLSFWVNKIRPVPEARCVDIERATGGAVTVEEIRPDVPWARIKDKAWPHPKGRPTVDFARTEAA
jgi:DNA-binding transcriptional regulator YdaS (Cro superfamily)